MKARVTYGYVNTNVAGMDKFHDIDTEYECSDLFDAMMQAAEHAPNPDDIPEGYRFLHLSIGVDL